MLIRIFLSLLMIAVFSTSILACDICGCGVGSYYIGILPEFKKRFIGIRYQHKGLKTHIGPNGSISYLSSDETYQTLDIWGAWNIGKKFRIMGFIPYNVNQRTSSVGSVSKSGIGDIALNGYYQVFNQRKTIHDKKLLVHSLWVGAGLKLPTGEYNPADKNAVQGSQNSFQLGTGSVDGMLNAMYDLRIQDLGMNANISYKFNSANKYDYTYGNKFTVNWLTYYKIRLNKKIMVAPNAGCLFEFSAKDRNKYGSTVFESGGQLLMGTLGAEMTFGNIGIGGNYQTPLQQNLAENTVLAKPRVLVQVTWAF
ncbi:transporter [Flavihumibacter fluvii]|uniref:transporter n=1 Tax=Flavihumibacter fluvii TaxID=2838157 RepID=UPI001EFB9DDE|nr:transporter [Flavihumibacter fluvii]ULQ51281.1 transporter [Flavihumibacter fluvii]